MILYFSATGNSRYVALKLAELSGDKTIDMTLEATPASNRGREDILGIIYPVHAWGIPRIVCDFLKRIEYARLRHAYVYAVCTCGDDIGKNELLLRRLLRRLGSQLHSMWSVQMPNTYVSFPFFNVDQPDVIQKKIVAAQQKIIEIAFHVNQKEKNIIDTVPGTFAGLKSYLLRPFFNKFLIGDSHAKALSACCHCGKCVMVCPLKNISMDSRNMPRWNGHCITCLACYHYCPQHCIEFSRFTKNKGQYYFKEVTEQQDSRAT